MIKQNNIFNFIFSLFTLLLVCIQANIQFEPSCGSTNATTAAYCTSKYITVGATTPTAFRSLARSTDNFQNFFGSLYDNQRKNIFELNDTYQIVSRKGQQVIDFSNDPNFGGIVLGVDSQAQVYYVWGFGPPYPSSLQAFVCTQNNKQDEFGDYTFRITSLVQLTVAANVSGIWDITGGTTYNNQLVVMTEGNPPDTQLLGDAKCLVNPKSQDCLQNTDPTEVMDLLEFQRFTGDYPTDYNDTLKSFSLDKLPHPFNPYWYGYPIGVTFSVGDSGPTVSGIRYYNMGRLDARGVLIMNDGVTAYLPSASGGLFKFVMSNQGDLSVGRLYVASLSRAKTTQDPSTLPSGTPDYQLSVKWIPLSDAPISNSDANKTITATDMPNTIQALTGVKSPDAGGNCGSGKSLTIAGNTSCFAVPKDQTAAFRVLLAETQKYASTLGGTVDSLYYGAMTNTTNSTFLTVNRVVSEGSLTLDDNPCGCIFQGDFDVNYNIYQLRPFICGVSNGQGACSDDYPANPRSAASIPKYNRVFIGEESPNHNNNFLWFVNPETRNASRIMSAPLAGGFNYLGYQSDIYDVNYLSVSIAHPYQGLNTSNINMGNTSGVYGWTGYFTINEANQQISYEPIAVPYTSGDTSLVGTTNAVTYGTGYNLSAIPLLEAGKKYGNGNTAVTMAQYGQNGQPLSVNGGNPAIGTSIKASFVPCGNQVASVVTMSGLPSTQFEIDMGVSTKTGNLGILSKGNVSRVLTEWNDDQWGGLWNTKTGRVSSYLSLINGEIWEPDASFFYRTKCGNGGRCIQSDVNAFATYFGEQTIGGKAQKFNPYQYGYALETNVTQTKTACAVNAVRKLYTLGRFSHGDFVFMGDNKTVYMADYNATGAFFKFTADNPADFSSGVLSAAKFTASDNTFNSYGIDWIDLGHGNQADLTKAIAAKPQFSDIFEIDTPDKSGACSPGFTIVPLDEGNPECLKVKDDTLAPFLESRRYAVLKNATVQLSFMSSLTLNSAKTTILASFESVQGRMAEKVNVNDKKSPKPRYPLDVQFNQIPCGLIVSMPYDPNTFALSSMSAALQGTSDPNDGADTTNTCSTATMARPTSLYTAADQMIIIGENSNTPENVDGNPGAKSFLPTPYAHQYPSFWQLDLDDYTNSRQNGQTMFSYGFKGGSISNFQYVQFDQHRHIIVSLGAPADGSAPPTLMYMGKYAWAVDKSAERLSITADGGATAPVDSQQQTQLQDQQSIYKGPSGSGPPPPPSKPSSTISGQRLAYSLYFSLFMLCLVLLHL